MLCIRNYLHIPLKRVFVLIDPYLCIGEIVAGNKVQICGHLGSKQYLTCAYLVATCFV